MLDPYVNDVVLVGRLRGETRTKPLGDEGVAVEWRLAVERPGQGRGAVCDVFSCISFDEEVEVLAAGWEPGDLLEVRGGLRRRFWTTSSGTKASRIEIEVEEVDLLEVTPA